jgi:hypothetical protein
MVKYLYITVLHINHRKGKPVETQGHKASGATSPECETPASFRMTQDTYD